MADENLVTLLSTTFLVLAALAAVTSSEATTKYQCQNLKETNIVFYMHDLVTGSNITAKMVAADPDKPWSAFNFGTVSVADDKLTEEYSWNSREIGRVRGTYFVSAVDGSDDNVILSLLFTTKEFNGSTLEVQGCIFQNKELSVVSGTGKFRMARGFAILDTAYFNASTLNSVLKWNVKVLHY